MNITRVIKVCKSPNDQKKWRESILYIENLYLIQFFSIKVSSCNDQLQFPPSMLTFCLMMDEYLIGIFELY